MNMWNHPGSGMSDGLAQLKAAKWFVIFGFICLFVNGGGWVFAIILWIIAAVLALTAGAAEEKHQREIDEMLHRGKYDDKNKK